MNTTEFLTLSSLIVPERAATVFEGHRTSFSELQERVNRLANGLADLGVGAGDRVAAIQVNCPEHIEGYFAGAKLDAIYVPLNFRVRANELGFMLDDCTPKVLLAGERYAEMVKSVGKSVQSLVGLEHSGDSFVGYEELLAGASDEERFPEADEDDAEAMAVICYDLGGIVEAGR